MGAAGQDVSANMKGTDATDKGRGLKGRSGAQSHGAVQAEHQRPKDCAGPATLTAGHATNALRGVEGEVEEEAVGASLDLEVVEENVGLQT